MYIVSYQQIAKTNSLTTGKQGDGSFASLQLVSICRCKERIWVYKAEILKQSVACFRGVRGTLHLY